MGVSLAIFVGVEAVERGDGAEGLPLVIIMSVVTSVSTVGRRRCRRGRAPVTGNDPGAFFDRVGDVRLDLLDRLHVK